MQALLRAGLDAGGLGFSSSWARTHNDAEGHMVPSRYATHDEIVELATRHAASSRARRSSSSRRSARSSTSGPSSSWPTCRSPRSGALNWNVMSVNAGNLDECYGKLAAVDYARGEGRQGRRAHDPDELRRAPLVPLRLRARRHARLGIGRCSSRSTRSSRSSATRRNRARAQRARAGRRQPAARVSPTGATRSSSTSWRPRTSSTAAARWRRSPRSRAATPWDVLVRHRGRRRAQHELRHRAARRDRRRLEGPRRGLARRARGDRRVRRRRAPRPPRVVQLRHRAARPGGPRARAPAARGGRPPHHRRAGQALRPPRPGPDRRGLRTPTSSCSTRTPSASDRSRMQIRPPRRRRPAVRRRQGIEHVLVNGRAIVRDGELTDERSGTLLRSGRDTRTAPLT